MAKSNVVRKDRDMMERSHMGLLQESDAPFMAKPNVVRRDRDVLNRANFGLLPEPEFSWSSFSASATVNGVVVALLLVISAASVHEIKKRNQEIVLIAPVSEPPPPPPPTVKLKPPPPEIIKQLAPPKIEVPKPVEIQKPEPVAIKMNTPTPVLPPAPPKAVTPPPAPKQVLLAAATPASVPNNSAHPTALALGDVNALKPSANAKAAAVSLGMAGMPPANSGQGARSVSINAGSGAPNGVMGGKDRGPSRIIGLANGVPGGTGPLTSTNRSAVSLGAQVAPPPPAQQQVRSGAMTSVTVVYKPSPVYSDEARQMHVQGTVDIEVVFHANGSVQILRVVHGLGHGLDESAVRSAEGIRFKPAMQDGHAVDQHTVVHIIFQLG